MKKHILFGALAIATMAFTACDEDYTDWKPTQQYAQEAPAAAYALEVKAGPDATIVMNGTQPDTAALVTITNNNSAIKTVTLKSMTVDGMELDYEVKDGNVCVLTRDLDALVETASMSRASTQRQLKVVTTIDAILTSGEAMLLTSETQAAITPAATPAVDPKGYALLGNFVGYGWDPSNPIWMTDKGDGIYEAVVETDGATSWFKFYNGSAFDDPSNFPWDAVAYGCAVADDSKSPNLLTWQDDPVWSLNTPTINKIGKWLIRLDVNNFSYSWREFSNELYLTGDHYNWGGSAADWKQLVPVYGTDDTFWTILYLHEGEQFKFAPQAGWGNDFGMSATVNDVAGAGVSGSDNIVIANAGWYLIKVVNGSERTVDILQPKVYLIGGVVNDNWNVDEANLFTIPTADDGEFVSPAFAKDAEVRMCISLDGIDWWKTEFIVTPAGNIDFRGRGGDQERVNVKAGQHAHLNFTAGTGSYQ